MSVNSVNNYPQQVQNFPNDRDFVQGGYGMRMQLPMQEDYLDSSLVEALQKRVSEHKKKRNIRLGCMSAGTLLGAVGCALHGLGNGNWASKSLAAFMHLLSGFVAGSMVGEIASGEVSVGEGAGAAVGLGVSYFALKDEFAAISKLAGGMKAGAFLATTLNLLAYSAVGKWAGGLIQNLIQGKD